MISPSVQSHLKIPAVEKNAGAVADEVSYAASIGMVEQTRLVAAEHVRDTHDRLNVTVHSHSLRESLDGTGLRKK